MMLRGCRNRSQQLCRRWRNTKGGGGTPIPIPINTIAVAFIKIQPSCHQSISFSLPREVTQRQCQHTAEINITNISHKQAQKRFFRGSFQVKWVDEENESLTEEEGEGRGFSEQVALKLYLHVQVFTFPLWCACQALHSSERTYVIAIVCLHCGIGLLSKSPVYLKVCGSVKLRICEIHLQQL